VLLAQDAVVTPSRAPATGLGGLSDGPPWLAILLAAALAGAIGGGTYRLARRRATRG
jgi:hypothetical protein